MNAVGRQVSRSNPAVHHQRQYSDNFLDASSKWFQSANLSQVRFLDFLSSIPNCICDFSFVFVFLLVICVWFW